MHACMHAMVSSSIDLHCMVSKMTGLQSEVSTGVHCRIPKDHMVETLRDTLHGDPHRDLNLDTIAVIAHMHVIIPTYI